MITFTREQRRHHREGDVYGKVFRSLWDGSLRGQADEQLVMIYLVAHSDAAGEVNVLPAKIGDDTGLGEERVRVSLGILEAPDAKSRTPDEAGRRLVRLDEHRDWGWRIVNHALYRGIKDSQQRREQVRASTARWREKKRVNVHQDHEVHGEHGEPKQKQRQKQQAEGEVESNAKQKDFDSSGVTVSDSEDNPQVNPDSKLSQEPKSSFWQSVKVKRALEELGAGGYSEDEAREVVRAKWRTGVAW